MLGDSIFDNAPYTGGAPDVVEHLRGRLPAGAKATLAAVDGATTGNVREQLGRLPADATHLVVSAGGNDALGHIDFLGAPASTSAEALLGLSGIVSGFERGYRGMLSEVLALGLPTAICTIYFPRFPEPTLQEVALTALATFNDCIIRTAIIHRTPLLDLRFVCTEEGDYADPIEPSGRGGEKIAAAVANLVRSEFAGGTIEVFTQGRRNRSG